MDKQKIYFPNLNGLRFIAALLVIIHHTEQMKSIFKLQNFWDSCPAIVNIGKLGVVLFFVLSGFLITFLLLAEENTQKSISIKTFYIRRILRIWPLYFFIIILALFVLPNINLFDLSDFGRKISNNHPVWEIILFVMLFPNLVLPIYGVVLYASHTWSIGTEEQYYLMWPLLLKYVKKNRITLMFCVIAAYLIVKTFLLSEYSDFIPYKLFILIFWYGFNIDCMAIGGFFAVLLFQKSKFLKLFINNYLFYTVLIITCLFLIKGVYIKNFHFESYAFLFGILILNFAANKEQIILLENRVFNYLGKISYGLYMYQPISIVLAIRIAKSLNITSSLIIYPLVFCITILIASISYTYFESIFLRLKPKFSKVLSGEIEKK